MIIYTKNRQLAAILTSYSQFNGCTGYALQPLTLTQLARLADILTTTYAGQWTVNFNGQPASRMEDSTEGVDGAHWQAFMLAPGEYGADTEDLINFIENVYGLPVDNNNYKQVAQMFRLWYAATNPGKYRNPLTWEAARYAELSLTNPADSARKSQRQRQRLANAANRVGFDTIGELAKAINDAGIDAIATIKGALRKS